MALPNAGKRRKYLAAGLAPIFLPAALLSRRLPAQRMFGLSRLYGPEEETMPIVTPDAKNHAGLATLASRYVDVADLPWVPTRFPGVDMKTLMEDKATGLTTALVRFAPGASLPDHEHVELEQTWVLEGALEDDEGVATAGSYVWRPAGNRHYARAPKGCIALSFFLKPNKFFDQPAA
jgi:quercetin dioxygenase-like cupin family protein